jgi:hypothetical protein
MARDHFSQQMSNPYFQTKHYREESRAAEMEKNIESKIKSILNKFKLKKYKKK